MPSLEEWKSRYEEKAPFPLKFDGEVMFDPDAGFLTWKFDPEEKSFWIMEICGDAFYWRPFVMEKAKELGAKTILTMNRYSPKAMKAAFGMSLACSLYKLEV